MDTALALLQAENAELRVQLAERDVALAVAAAQIEALSFNLAVLKRRQFGQSSEKLTAEIEQLELYQRTRSLTLWWIPNVGGL